MKVRFGSIFSIGFLSHRSEFGQVNPHGRLVEREGLKSRDGPDGIIPKGCVSQGFETVALRQEDVALENELGARRIGIRVSRTGVVDIAQDFRFSGYLS